MKAGNLLATAAGVAMLAGCAGQFGNNTAALSPMYPVPRGETHVVAGPFQTDSGSEQTSDVTAGGGGQAMTGIVAGGRSMVLLPASNGQGMPESVNSLPPGAANPY